MSSLAYDVTGVVLGGDVTQSSPAAQTVDVAAGSAMVGGVSVVFAGVTGLAIAAADPTQDRWDAVVVNNTGTISVLTGTISDGINAVMPDTTGYCLLSGVYVVNQSLSSYTGTILTQACFPTGPIVPLPEPSLSFTYTFLPGANSNADPGTAKCGFDAATNAAITKLFLSFVSATSDGALVRYWPNGQTGGGVGTDWYLIMWSRQDPGNWWLGRVSSETLHASWLEWDLTFIASSAGTTAPPLSSDPIDTQIGFYGIAPPTNQNGTAKLAGDVTMTTANTFYDGPNTGSVGGANETLLLIAHVTVQGGAAGVVTAKLWDGTTVFAQGQCVGGAAPNTITLEAIVTPSAAATYKITAAATQNSYTIKADPSVNGAGTKDASRISWLRLQ